MLKNKFFANAKWMIGGKIFQMAISLVVGMFTARYLGPQNYGLLNYGSAMISFFMVLCNLGLNAIIVNELINNKQKEGEIIGSSIVMRLFASIISIIMLILLTTIMSYNKMLKYIILLQSISLIFSSFDIINYWYQSKLKSKYATIIQSCAYVIMSLYKICILVIGKSVIWFAFSVSFEVLIVGVLLLISYYKNQGEKLSFSIVICKKLIKKSYYFIVAGIMITIYGQLDKLMIGNMVNTESVGLYSVALTISSLWSFIPASIIDSARPIIMEERNINYYNYIKKLKQLYAVIIWMSILYAMLITFFSDTIILILYGKEYLQASSTLIIVVWYCAFSFLGAAKNIWLICEGKSKYENIFTFAGVICNVLLNIILIPILGINGAAIATLITQCVTNFLMPLVFKATRRNSVYIIEAFLLKNVFDKNSIKRYI